jgi:translation initiation factor 1
MFSTKVHVRLQQRNGKKCITTVTGIDKEFDIKKIASKLAPHLQTRCTVKTDETTGDDALQLSGDQRTNVRDFLISQEICVLEQITVHGY